jgi:hypothetical protein
MEIYSAKHYYCTDYAPKWIGILNDLSIEVQANTKSEARAALKERFKIKLSKGFKLKKMM